jgi:hypothetical protein
VWGDQAYKGQGEVIRKHAPNAQDFTNRQYRYHGVVDEAEEGAEPHQVQGRAQHRRDQAGVRVRQGARTGQERAPVICHRGISQSVHSSPSTPLQAPRLPKPENARALLLRSLSLPTRSIRSECWLDRTFPKWSVNRCCSCLIGIRPRRGADWEGNGEAGQHHDGAASWCEPCESDPGVDHDQLRCDPVLATLVSNRGVETVRKCGEPYRVFPEAVWLESRHDSETFTLHIIARFGLGRRDLADQLEQAAVVEPVHPLERGEFHGSASRQGPRRWITSALNSPWMVSARALS